MSNTIETPTAPAEPTTVETPALTTAENPAEEQDARNPGREAAKYRTQLRAVEGERDALTGTVATLQKQIIEGIITDQVKVSPTGVFAVNTVADFLGEDGMIDPKKVFEVASATAVILGLEQKARTPQADPSVGPRNDSQPAPTWGEFLSKN
jgi:hypothetical protein